MPTTKRTVTAEGLVFLVYGDGVQYEYITESESETVATLLAPLAASMSRAAKPTTMQPSSRVSAHAFTAVKAIAKVADRAAKTRRATQEAYANRQGGAENGHSNNFIDVDALECITKGTHESLDHSTSQK